MSHLISINSGVTQGLMNNQILPIAWGNSEDLESPFQEPRTKASHILPDMTGSQPSCLIFSILTHS